MDTLEQLEASLNGDPILVAGPAPIDRIDEIEAFAGFNVPTSYSEFVRRYGGAIVGPYPIFGWGASDAMSELDVSAIKVTKRFRADSWPETQNTLVISTDHAGNPVTINASGTVQRFDHDIGKSEIIAEDFIGFVEWCLSQA